MRFIARRMATHTLGLCLALAAVAPAPLLAANPSIRALVDGVEPGPEQADEAPRVDIAAMDVAIRVHGLSADVTVRSVLANTGDDEIEARYVLDLPMGAVVTGYALDIDGKMIPGQLLEQPKARQVFEDIERRGRDPGLAEGSAANRFQTRVSPSAAGGQPTIEVHFSVPIRADGTLDWPIETDGKVGKFHFVLSASGLQAMPAIALPVPGRVSASGAGTQWQAGHDVAQVRLAGAIRLSGMRQKGEVVIARHANGRGFFDLSDSLTGAAPAEKPRRVRVYWDASRSRREALLADERALLEQYLAWAGAPVVDLVRFTSDDPQARVGLDAAAALKAIDETTYRGATSFAGLDRIDLPAADACLLFSDGEATLDKGRRLRSSCPLAVIASGPAAAGDGAARIAAERNGRMIRLEAGKAAEALGLLTARSIAVVSVEDEQGAELEFTTLPAGPQGWRIVGAAPRAGGIRVRLDGVPRARRELLYSVDAGGSGKLDAPGAIWAARKLARLDEDPDDHDAMLALARRFNVASPSLAFLVLENQRDYINADLTPPEGFGEEWLADYRTQLAERERERRDEKRARLDGLLENWRETVAWWEKDFDQRAAFREARKQADEGGRRDGEPRPAAMEGPPPPPPPPPPPANVSAPAPGRPEEAAAAAEGGTEELADIIVTSRRIDSGPAQTVPLEVTAIGTGEKVEINNLLSDRPYLAALDKAAPEARARALADLELAYGVLPGFYFDASEWFRRKGDAATARALLLSALDLGVANDETRVLVAFRLQAMGEHDRAVSLLERIVANTGYRPQPRRLLALALAARAAAAPLGRQRADLERAFELLCEVALSPRIRAYDGIDMIALMEANALIPRIEAAGGAWSLDPRLVRLLDADVRVVAEWTSPDADVDLWLIEPTGERAYYGHKQTLLGGLMSDDMTDGYGPEQYFLRRAAPGDYTVKIHGFSADAINPNGPSRVMVRLFRDFGRPGQSEDVSDGEISFNRADSAENERAVATFKVGKPGKR